MLANYADTAIMVSQEGKVVRRLSTIEMLGSTYGARKSKEATRAFPARYTYVESIIDRQLYSGASTSGRQIEIQTTNNGTIIISIKRNKLEVLGLPEMMQPSDEQRLTKVRQARRLLAVEEKETWSRVERDYYSSSTSPSGAFYARMARHPDDDRRWHVRVFGKRVMQVRRPLQWEADVVARGSPFVIDSSTPYLVFVDNRGLLGLQASDKDPVVRVWSNGEPLWELSALDLAGGSNRVLTVHEELEQIGHASVRDYINADGETCVSNTYRVVDRMIGQSTLPSDSNRAAFDLLTVNGDHIRLWLDSGRYGVVEKDGGIHQRCPPRT